MSADDHHTAAAEISSTLNSLPGVNTYCVNQKDADRGYARRWRLRVVWDTSHIRPVLDDGTSRVSEYSGDDSPTGFLSVYQAAHREATRRGLLGRRDD